MRATAASRALVAGPTLTRTGVVLGGGVLALLGTIVAAIGFGSVEVAAGDTLAVLAHRLLGIGSASAVGDGVESIVMDLRLPRALTAALVGAGLGCAGAVFQALLRNPLADPYIIGTAAGASLGAIAGLILPRLVPTLAIGAGSAWLGLGIVQALAFVGGLGAVSLVLALARTGSRIAPVTLLLTGYAVSAMLAAGVALMMFFSGDALSAIFAWLMGSLAGASWAKLAFAAPIVAISFALLLVRWRRLNVLLLGEEPATHLGLSVEREKLALTALATVVTSAVVAVAGTIGFVGLVVPHLLRLTAGPDHRLLLPASLLYGGSLLVVADLLARLAGGIPVGVITALLGAPFFLWLLGRSRLPAVRAP